MLRVLWLSWIFSFCLWAETLWPPENFQEAKIFLKKHPFPAFATTFFCDFSIQYPSGKLQCSPEWSEESCVLEWDHLVPISFMAKKLPCWESPSCPWDPSLSHRNCCQNYSQEFRYLEGFLYNLVPVVKELNRSKSNFLPGKVLKAEKNLCGVKFDGKKRLFEPPDHRKGWVARVYLFLDQIYGLNLSFSQKMILHQWDKNYPPTAEEKKHQEDLNKLYHLGENTL